MSDNERDLRIKQLTSQVSQIEHWTFEALREARRARVTAQVILITLLFALIAAFVPSVLIRGGRVVAAAPGVFDDIQRFTDISMT